MFLERHSCIFKLYLFFLSETTKIFTWINYWQVSSDSTHSRESCSLKAISSKFILKSTEIHVQSNMNLNKANFRSIYSKDSSEAFYLEFSVIFKLFYKYHQRKLKEVNFNITYTKSSTLTVSILTEISFSQKMIFLKFHDFPLIFMEFLLISAKKG